MAPRRSTARYSSTTVGLLSTCTATRSPGRTPSPASARASCAACAPACAYVIGDPEGSRRNSRCAAAARGQSVPKSPASARIGPALSSEALEQAQLEGLGQELVPRVDADLEGVLAAVLRGGGQLVEARAVRVGRAGGAQ